jgi:predicted ester cyclase
MQHVFSTQVIGEWLELIAKEQHLSDFEIMSLEESHARAQRNKASYLAAKAAFNARDLDLCVSFYAPDHQIMSKPTPPGREHIRAFFEGTFATWPDVELIVEHAVAEGNCVMGRSVSIANHGKAVMGVPPTGKRIETTFWDLHLFNDDGLIVQSWNLMDSLSVMQQLGLVPTQ